MNPKLLLALALILGGGLLGWHIARRHHTEVFLERLQPPSADQVKKWAGFPEKSHLTLLTNFPGDVGHDNKSENNFMGRYKWLWIYEDRKGSNYLV